MRILFRNYDISENTKRQLLYGTSGLVSIVSIFVLIFIFSFYSDAPAANALPSPGTSAFTQRMDPTGASGKVAGAQTQSQFQPGQGQQRIEQPDSSSIGPSVPATPTPTASPTPTPPPTTNPTPAPTASPAPTSTPSPSTPPPSAPSGVTATSGCEGNNVKVVLTWSSTSGATSYKIFRDGNEIKDNVDATTYSDTSVTPGTLYAYSIKAKNGGGDSPHSDSKTITPTSCPASSASPSPSS